MRSSHWSSTFSLLARCHKVVCRLSHDFMMILGVCDVITMDPCLCCRRIYMFGLYAVNKSCFSTPIYVQPTLVQTPERPTSFPQKWRMKVSSDRAAGSKVGRQIRLGLHPIRATKTVWKDLNTIHSEGFDNLLSFDVMGRLLPVVLAVPQWMRW